MALMTGKELLATALIGAVAVGLLVYFWPYPSVTDIRQIEDEVWRDFVRQQQGGKKPPRPENPNSAEMKEAAAELAKQFPAVRDAALKAAGEGGLGEPEPFAGELPAPGEIVAVHMMLVCDDKPTYDRDKGRSRIWLEGLESLDFDNNEKTGPDYDKLASVLAAMALRRQADAGEALTVEMVPGAFVPLESLKKAAEAAARAGVTRIRLKESPLPH